MEQMMQVAIIQKEIGQLSGKNMSIVQLYYFNELTFEEISYILNMTLQQVETHYNLINTIFHGALWDAGLHDENNSNNVMDYVIQAFENILSSCELTVEKSKEIYNKIMESSKGINLSLRSINVQANRKKNNDIYLINQIAYIPKENQEYYLAMYDPPCLERRDLMFKPVDKREFLVKFSKEEEVRHIKGFSSDISLLQRVVVKNQRIQLILSDSYGLIDSTKSYVLSNGVVYFIDEGGYIYEEIEETFTVVLYDQYLNHSVYEVEIPRK